MSTFTIKLYKKYPFTKGGERVPRPANPAGLSAMLDKYLVKTINCDGVFYEAQGRVIVNDFDAVDGCNFCAVTIDPGDTHYYFIDDIIRVAGAPAPDCAEIYLTEDIFLTDFFQPAPDGFLTPYSIAGRIAQTDYNFDAVAAFYKTRPIEPVYKAPQITVKEIYPDGTQYAFIGFFTTDKNIISAFIITDEVSPTRGKFLDYAAIAGSVSKISIQPDIPEAPWTDYNIEIVNLFAVPFAWVSGLCENDQKHKYETVSGLSGYYYIFMPDALKAGILKVAELDPGEITVNKTTLKTATHEEELSFINQSPGAAGSYTIDIYMEISPNASDTLTILAAVNNKMLDLTGDFKVDFAINAQALEFSQHKATAAINTVATVIGAVGGVVGGVTSGNYFGAVSSAIAGVEGVTGQISGLKTPAALNNAGNAANAIILYGGIAFYEYENAANATAVATEISRHGYIYPDAPYYDVADIVTARGLHYIKLIDAEIVGNFGANSASELAEQFARGITFVDV